MNTDTQPLPAAAAPAALLQSLQHRYAVKQFDPQGKIGGAEWKTLEHALHLAPSSYGLQPWKFVVVEDKALREKLRSASWNQSQITDADKLVVFAAREDFGAADVERFIDRISEVRGQDKAELDGYKQMMLKTAARPADELAGWTARQVYIALGVFLTSAAVLGVDACPMEGFEPAKYDEILGLKGYRTVVVAAAGRRAAGDTYAQAPKVRYPIVDVIAHI